MSEHTPITGELREAVEWEPTFCGPDRAMVPQPEFDSLCDAIDAVHAGLERENAELRERLAVLDNRSESMHIGSATVTITDELRKWAEGDALRAGMSLRTARDQALAIADRIDAAVEGMADAYLSGTPTDEELAELGWVRKEEGKTISTCYVDVVPRFDWKLMALELEQFAEIVRGMAGDDE